MGRTTRSVPRDSARVYVRKSDEFQRSAEQALERGDWDAAVSHTIHAVICAADAFTVFYGGERSASEAHDDVLRLLAGLRIDRDELHRSLGHLRALLALKSTAEYEDRLLSERDARVSLQHADRFRAWALAKVAARG